MKKELINYMTNRKYLVLSFAATLFFSGYLLAQAPNNKMESNKIVNIKTLSESNNSSKNDNRQNIDSVTLNNQMMMVFMERMRGGNYKEARQIAEQMILDRNKFKSTKNREYKTFYSLIEKELYKILESRKKNDAEIIWIEKPISDGFYLLAILDFQEGKHDSALKGIQNAIFWNPVRSAFYTERGFMLLNNKAGSDGLMARIAYLKALELADNPEDFAAALNGLGFIHSAIQQYDIALACLTVSNDIIPKNSNTEESIFAIQRQNPQMVNEMTIEKAKTLMKNNKIPFTYAPEHVEVLLLLADRFEKSEEFSKAIEILSRAKYLDPRNKEVIKQLEQLKKK